MADTVGLPVAPVAAVVHGQEIHVHAVVECGEVVVVRDDFAVAVEKQDVESRFPGCVEAGAHGHVPVHGDQDVL